MLFAKRLPLVITSQFNVPSKLSFTAAWYGVLGKQCLQPYKASPQASHASEDTKAPRQQQQQQQQSPSSPLPRQKNVPLTHSRRVHALRCSPPRSWQFPSQGLAAGAAERSPAEVCHRGAAPLPRLAGFRPGILCRCNRSPVRRCAPMLTRPRWPRFTLLLTPGSQISCFSPTNFTGKQSAYVDTACWDSLIHHGFDDEGHTVTKSLWALKVFPYSLLVVAVLMYMPYLLWRYAAAPALHSDLLFIIDELDKSYNRSVRLVQHMRKVQQASAEPERFWEEYERARRERYFEFPLLERYLTCKQHTHSLVFIYILRNLLLLLFLAATCLYLVFLHLNIFFQDEFSCSIKTGLLQAEPHIPWLIPCKLVFFSVFQLISLSIGGVYVLLIPVVIYNALQLCQWDKGLLSVYEMLPAFDLLSRKMLTCPINDLNIILLFLRANISELTSFSRLNAVSALREATANKEDIDTVIDFMTLLAGLETTKPKHQACAPEPDGSMPLSNGGALEMKPGVEAMGKASRDSLGSA
ncbi:pannexin-3 isoform X1 [Falco rusticolus]|uniref:pannexin-3 isoform X1 n=1 Tax=Falco rusticolus TaxID=120794 RepID=UPI0018866E8E|nr:pannexin-3 isoform X1 [Falco rusticolus]